MAIIGNVLNGGGGGGVGTSSNYARSSSIQPLWIESLISSGINNTASSLQNNPSPQTIQTTGSVAAGARILTASTSPPAAFLPTPDARCLAAVLQPAGTNDYYLIEIDGFSGTTMYVTEPLPVAVPAGSTIHNRHDNNTSGQHYTGEGYKGYARHLFYKSPVEASVANLIGKYLIDAGDNWTDTSDAAQPSKQLWQPTGGAATRRFASNENPWLALGILWFGARQKNHLVDYTGSGAASLTAQIRTDNNSGYLIQECSIKDNDSVPSNLTQGTIDVYATSRNDYGGGPGAGISTETLIFSGTFYRQVKRFVIPVCASEEIRVVLSRFADGVSTYRSIVAGRTDFVIGSISAPRRIFSSGDKTLIFGDSWTDPTGSFPGFSSELQRFMTQDNGGSLVTEFTDPVLGLVQTALSGATSAYALDWFQNAIAVVKPTKVLFHYFTNDLNNVTNTLPSPSGGTEDYNICFQANVSQTVPNAQNILANNIRKLVDLCVAAGIQPIVMMPACTNGASQTIIHGVANYNFGQPSHIGEYGPTASATDLAFKYNPLNSRGKYAGKMVANWIPGGTSNKIYIANGPGLLDSWAEYGSAAAPIVPS